MGTEFTCVCGAGQTQGGRCSPRPKSRRIRRARAGHAGCVVGCSERRATGSAPGGDPVDAGAGFPYPVRPTPRHFVIRRPAQAGRRISIVWSSTPVRWTPSLPCRNLPPLRTRRLAPAPRPGTAALPRPGAGSGGVPASDAASVPAWCAPDQGTDRARPDRPAVTLRMGGGTQRAAESPKGRSPLHASPLRTAHSANASERFSVDRRAILL